MNNKDETALTADYDPLVREAYRTGATEVTPAHLDQAVLSEAARAIDARTSMSWPNFSPKRLARSSRTRGSKRIPFRSIFVSTPPWR
jgi:hypothetical protein